MFVCTLKIIIDHVTGQRLREASEGSASLQKRRFAERATLHYQAPERREHSKEHKEPTRRMIAEATWLLHSQLNTAS